jgi:hypothetical protein
MPELPRVYYLVWFPNPGGNATNWIFDSNARDWRIHKGAHERKRILGQLLVSQAASSPVHPR